MSTLIRMLGIPTAFVVLVVFIIQILQIFLATSVNGKVTCITALVLFISTPFLHKCGTAFFYIFPKVIYKSLFRKHGKEDGKLFFKEHCTNAVVLPSDLDLYFHMNNARYQTQIDVARASFYVDCGLKWMFTKPNNPYFVVAAVTSRYRKSLQLFQRYKILTKVLYWDHNSVYIEHKFVSRYGKIADFIYYVCIFQMRVMNSTPLDFFKEVLSVEDIQMPTPSEEVECFINFNKFSSINLKKTS